LKSPCAVWAIAPWAVAAPSSCAEANALVPTAIHAVEAELNESRVGDQFDLRVIAGDGRLEVPAVMRLESQPSRATECRPPQPRARRQAPDQSVDEREDAGEAQAEALLKTAAGVGSHGQWLAHDLHVLLRHLPPSIPFQSRLCQWRAWS